jgi:hypothetical protein
MAVKLWSVTPREEHWLRMFENMVLRRIVGFKIRGSDKRMENAAYELRNLYSSPHIIGVIRSRLMRWVRAGSIHESCENCR